MRAWRHALSTLFASSILAAVAQGVSFAPATSFSTGAGTSPVAIAARDINRDGKLDLAVALGFANPASVPIFLGDGAGGFVGGPVPMGGNSAFSVAVGDFDRDGVPDLAATMAGSHVVTVYLAAGTAAGVSYPVGFVPQSVAIADFNRDGKQDLVVANQFSDTVSVLLGVGNGTFAAATHWAAGDAPVSVAVGDFDLDGKPDIVTADAFSDTVSFLRGQGNGTFLAAVALPTGAGHPAAVAVGDLNGDGKPDIVVARQLPNVVSVMLGNGNGTFAAPVDFAVGGSPTGLALADFDGDGKLDVAASGGAGNVYVLRGNGAGALGAAASFAVGVGPRAIVAGDFNGDAIADLATANNNGSSVSLLLNSTPFVVSAMAWGDNRDGAVGDGNLGTINATPVAVQNLTRLVSVAAGAQHSVAVRADGTVWSWGAGYNFGLGNGTTFNPAPTPVQVSNIGNAVAVAAGVQHTLALAADTTVWGWGLNSLGQLGIGTTNDAQVPAQVSGLSGVVALAAGGGHSLALKADGTVWAFGRNDFGQLGDGTQVDRTLPVQVSGLTNVVAIGAGATDWHSLAVKGDGTVWAWGRNNWGQLGDGTLVDRLTPVQVGGLGNVKRVAAGTGHSVAVKSDGTVWTWGGNMHGQLGDGTTTDRLFPVQVAGLAGVRSVTAGMTHTVVLKADGTVWAWGANSFSGQLGDGSLIEQLTPVQVSGISAASMVATGGQHSVVILGGATLAGLAAMVQEMALAPGVANALGATLQSAQAALDADNVRAACGSLGAFERQVRAHRARAIPAVQADRLLGGAARVEAQICG